MKKAQPWIGLLVRLGLGGVLLYAGYLKAFTPDKSMMLCAHMSCYQFGWQMLSE